jgi:aminoglycoside phosphotransferase (APT) family kinase protein
MGITKNHQPEETLRAMTAAAFPQKQLLSVTELTEGMFNAAYRVDFADGTASVLKIAAADAQGFLSNEINLMQAEVAAMELLHSHGIHQVPRVLFSDFSRSLCSGTYFFMEVVPGRSLNACREDLTDETVGGVLYEAGCFQRQLKDIRDPQFGLLGDSRRFDRLSDMLRYMFHNLLRDAKERNIQFCFDPAEMLSLLEKDAPVFDQRLRPSLVHWDIWEGNIFVDQGRLSGIIDWERAMWADPFMDDRFRSSNHNPAFLKGYGQDGFTPEEMRRILWYDVFLYATMQVEGYFRQYENLDGYLGWVMSLQKKAWQGLKDALSLC